MNQQIYYLRPRSLFFSAFVFVFLLLCLLEWFDKKRITRADIRLNTVIALVSAGFMLFVTWFGLP